MNDVSSKPTPLSERTEWHGTSPQGLPFEISFWGKGSMNDGAGMWNYYVLLHEDQFHADDFAKVWLPVVSHYQRSSGHQTPTYDKYNSILNAGDFHGGITFYRKNVEADGSRRWVKVGCDFGHSWDRDMGYPFDLEWVKREALETCAKLAELLHPLARCGYTGQYFDPRFDVSEEVSGWKGGALSPAGLGCRSSWDRKGAEERAAIAKVEQSK